MQMNRVSEAVKLKIFRESVWYKKRKSSRVLFWREITPLAFPLFIEGLCVLLMGVFSTLLVSWLGKEAMAAVGLADSFNMLIAAFFASVALGTSVVVAFSLGQRKRQQAQTAARQSMTLLVLISLLLVVLVHFSGQTIIDLMANQADPSVKAMALTYLHFTVWNYPAMAITLVGCGALRGAGNTRLPMLINISMNILNIVISSILIYGLFNWQGLGFIGAGIGITLARYAGALVVVVLLIYGANNTLRIPFKAYFMPFTSAIMFEVLSIGIPASVESVMFNIGKLITQRFVAGMGTDVIAGNFIAFSIVAIINLPGNALGYTSTIIIGTRLGKGQILQPIRQIKHIFWLSTLGVCFIALLSIPSAGFLASLYTDDPAVITVVKHLIWMNALFMPIWAASWVLPAGLKGAKDASYTMWVALVGMWGCRIIAGYILGVTLGFGVTGVWMGMFLDWIVRGVLFYRRMSTGRWLWRYRPSV
ncbi:EmmdR/YeeO family multidrug/toxin efflux MATE transporter [Yersinia pseudotuberculosis]|uniref:Multidrug-efflux transporter n=1 Tax=Yersinia pseudotuberculosis TaxID=633 RepID=A0ABM7AN04_YERPU|nr:EmmdR/YeeO family multidrug/toxin efflux MATE transporter [Yersinia pseudotuberculosis]AYW93592.1 EmmdR/YeeO family multidrug/toxin efflux MATE transporter [Yersinia pseudotuberculosis]MBO1632226.1 EmmdR/YeeO family multidrug/toxin efflux MATE transporter [Yersinia pseudotuberculosis]MBP0071936.1 EmmdR/YeeO family multidrug/toxin efflux MATE transporter [Yersinia pseudotuberculosis]